MTKDGCLQAVDTAIMHAYRYNGDVDLLRDSVKLAVDNRIIVAGDITSFGRIKRVISLRGGALLSEGDFREEVINRQKCYSPA